MSEKGTNTGAGRGERTAISRRDFLRRAAIGSGLLVAPALLSACGGGGRENEAQGPVEIEYWHIFSEASGGPEIKELISMFQEQNPNITVRERFQEGYTGLLENVQSALAADKPPDVATIGYLYLNYVAANFPFTSMEDLVGEYETGDYFGAFPENILELGRAQGRQVGMPYSISNIISYYNADILDQSGVDPNAPPQTWEEWRQAARSIKDATGKPCVFIYLDDNWGVQSMMESNGGRMLDCRDGETAATFDSPEAVEAMGFWADLVEEGLALNALNEQGQQAFLSGEVAAFFYTVAVRENLQRQASFDLRATRFPEFGGRERRLAAGGNNLFVFSRDPSRRRAAWEFVKFLESAESLTIWDKGTGYLPPREGVADDPRYLGDFMRENPIQAVAVEQTPLVVPWTSFPGPNGLQASKVLFSGVQEALGGQSDVEEALQGAATEVNEMIEGQACS